MCAGIISPQDFKSKGDRCTENQLWVNRTWSITWSEESLSRKWCLVGMETLVRPTTTETPCECVCKQHDAFSKPHIQCGHTLTSKFSIHKMSHQYFVTGCFSRSGVKKIDSDCLSISLCTCRPGEPVQENRVAYWYAAICDCGFNVAFSVLVNFRVWL